MLLRFAGQTGHQLWQQLLLQLRVGALEAHLDVNDGKVLQEARRAGVLIPKMMMKTVRLGGDQKKTN